ncbi:PREDICTED: uncharacterized protein LOC104802552 [Tarenaya hassleriana]|uniref:uncharacterized protein LOC104802552 n=1 Tax=Tarenaya hassleriana TaxID=28532 RepID=UPI00053C32F5|nr:PREDICTED: uncharacterized protein LOC104802552 [Tarenaya hassleriana]
MLDFREEVEDDSELKGEACSSTCQGFDPLNDLAYLRDSGSSSIQTSGNVSMKKGNAIMRVNDASDNKPIRVRIKIGSKILSRKVAVVHRGPGLVDSPDLPPENSHNDSCMPYSSLDTPNESPSSILREMTSVPVPEGLLMSPLPDILLHAMEKPKQNTVADNELVVKVRKELPVLSPNMSSDVLGNERTLSGKKKRVVGFVDATTCKESPSLEEIKKQKEIPVDQRARKKLTCGLGGVNDSSTFKHKLQKDIYKDGEIALEVVLKKSNKIIVSGGRLEDPFLVSSEELKRASSTKSKENICTNRFGAKLLFGATLEDNAYIGQNNMDIGLGSEAAPPSTSLQLDNWVQCDSCETWRLLPFGMKPEQLPDKWLCCMQIWLPNMNRCEVSQEETTSAVISLNQISGSGTHNLENGVTKFVSNAGRVDQSHQPLTSSLLLNRTKKKSTGKDLPKGGLVITRVEAASSRRSNLQVPGQINTVENHSAGRISKAHEIGMSGDVDKEKYVTAQKAKRLRAGTACQVRAETKQENDQEDGENSKKTKDHDGNALAKKIKSVETPWILNLKRNTAERSTKPSDNGFPAMDLERDTEKKALASKEKLDHQSQSTTGAGPFAAKAYDKTIAPAKRKKLVEYKDGRGQVSGTATLSSSKVLGSHKSGRAYAKGVKASPEELISSSPKRSSCTKDLASAGDSISQNLHRGDAGSRIINKRTYPEGDCEFETRTHSSNYKQSKLELCDQNSKFGGLSYTNRNTTSRQNQLQEYPSETKADHLQSAVSQDNILKNNAAITKVSALTHGSMDSSCQVAKDILIEAKKLRKLADCLKSSGFERGHKEANFKASLKFLYGASLLEVHSGENVLNEKMDHVEAYRIAAKLSESCALEYETNQEMAAAALAYKCTEVACMRLTYGRSLGASRDWNSLQKMLQTSPKGESPSSSASDIDNLNHQGQGMVDKSSFTKGGLPHIAGNHLGVARSQQNFVQLLDFVEDMNLAMEASAKSQNAFRAATVSLEKSEFRDSVSLIKRVVNCSFHNVESLIRQVELAMDALSHSTFCGVKY